MMQFFKDGSGQLSSMRLTQFLVVLVILIVFFSVNAAGVFNSIKTNTPIAAIIDFPVQAVLLITAVIFGKVAQGIWIEKNSGSNPSNAPNSDQAASNG